MLKQISLKNFRSFGPTQQHIKFEPITILVGPNNAGKSSLVSVASLIREAVRFQATEVLGTEGGVDALCHRPGDRTFEIGWETDAGRYDTEIEFGKSVLISKKEELSLSTGASPWRTQKDGLAWPNGMSVRRDPFAGLSNTWRMAGFEHFNVVAQPLASSRTLRLSIEALRADAPPSENASLTGNGAGLAQVLARWRNSEPEKAAALDEFISKSVLPEVAHVLVFDAPLIGGRSKTNTPGTKRLGIRQQDNERFEAPQLSDGALSFIALAMYAIDLEPGAVLFIEEPETAIHPTRLPQLVDLFRRMASEKKAQIVLATHSPVLLDQFREEPEVIRVFRRSSHGSEVCNLSDLPQLAEALRRQSPGEMLSLGFFELAFDQLKRP